MDCSLRTFHEYGRENTRSYEPIFLFNRRKLFLTKNRLPIFHKRSKKYNSFCFQIITCSGKWLLKACIILKARCIVVRHGSSRQSMSRTTTRVCWLHDGSLFRLTAFLSKKGHVTFFREQVKSYERQIISIDVGQCTSLQLLAHTAVLYTAVEN